MKCYSLSSYNVYRIYCKNPLLYIELKNYHMNLAAIPQLNFLLYSQIVLGTRVLMFQNILS